MFNGNGNGYICIKKSWGAIESYVYIADKYDIIYIKSMEAADILIEIQGVL